MKPRIVFRVQNNSDVRRLELREADLLHLAQQSAKELVRHKDGDVMYLTVEEYSHE